MIMQVTTYNAGEIFQQYDEVGFRKALLSALVRLDRVVRAYCLADKDLNITMSFIGPHEWSACVEHENEELFGVSISRKR